MLGPIIPSLEPENTNLPAKPNEEDPVFIGKKREGLYQVNPLFQAAVAERLQFDGDIPELRVGKFDPKTQTPAIAVESQSLSTVSLGLEIQQAEKEVYEKLVEHDKILSSQMKDEITALQEQHGLVPKNLVDNIVQKYQSPNADPKFYPRQKLPSLVKAKKQNLILATSKQKQSAVWKVISTTQGRRSVSHTLAEVLKKRLTDDGFLASLNFDEEKTKHLKTVEWSFNLHGEQDLHEDFNHVGIAVSVLEKKVKKIILENGLEEVYLKIRSIDKVAERKVGWNVEIRI
jgi:hypothetical protein